MTDRIGCYVGLLDSLELVTQAEELGYESIWAPEGQGKTAFGKLERWATVTDTIKLATGIVNIYSRSPATVAQATATLDAHSDGRAILGLGVAHPGVVEDFHGMEFDRPLERMVEYIELVRRYLRGDPDGFEGEFFTPARTHFWEAFDPPRADVPIYNAALGPANVRLTGKYADGWLPNLYPVDRVSTALEWLQEGAKAGDRDVADVDVAMYLLTAVHEDADRARQVCAEHVTRYVREIPGYYDRTARESGFEDEIEAVRTAASFSEGAAFVSDAFLDQIAIIGTPDDARRQLQEFRELGVDLPIVRPPLGVGPGWAERTLNAFAPKPE